jgi:hypothetical protein
MDPPSLSTIPKRSSALTRGRLARFNVACHPVLAMMSDLSSGGLPLLVQFVGRHFAEPTLFQVAREWERVTGTDNSIHPWSEAGLHGAHSFAPGTEGALSSCQ